jgi:aminoglycoside phosphotransferase (APT) family kinase protein
MVVVCAHPSPVPAPVPGQPGSIRGDLAEAIGEEVMDVRPIPEGHSGFTYWVDLAGRRTVLRLPPPGARITGPADIPRQARLLRALHEAGVPVPEVLAMSDEPVVDGRPFYLTEKVEGMRIEDVAGSRPDVDIAGAAIDALLRLQSVRPSTTPLSTEPPMPLTGEIDRWGWLLERAPEELTGQAPQVAEKLRRTRPPESEPVLVHGDFHYGNMLFRDGRVAALLDWEIAEVGQPLLDLACLCVVANASEQDPHAIPGGGAVVVPERELLRMYGSNAADFQWFLALTYYKYAAIFGYNLMLHRRGKRPDPIYETRTGTIVAFLSEADRLLE